MGRRGPAPTPSKILKLRGSWRGKQNRDEPQAQPGKPRMPKGLPKPAAEIWRVLCRQLEEMAVLSVIDWPELERYCRYFVRWRECEDFIAEHGATYALKSADPAAYVGTVETKAADGTVIVEAIVGWRDFPQVRESHRLDKSLKQIEDRFGLSPSARARIRAISAGEEQVDPFEQLLKTKKARKKSG